MIKLSRKDAMASLLYRLGTFAARRAWSVIIAWVALLALTVSAYFIGAGTLSNSFDIPDTPSAAVTDELAEKLPDTAGGTGTVVYRTEDGSAFTPEQAAGISALATSAADLTDVAAVVDPFEIQEQRTAQEQQLTAGQAQADAAAAELAAAQDQLDAGRAQLATAAEQLEQARAQATAAGASPAQLAALDGQLQQVTAQASALDSQQDQLDAGRTTLEEQTRQLRTGTDLAGFADGIGVISDDESTAIVNVSFTEPRLELSEPVKEAVIEHFESQPIDGVEVAFGTDLAQGVPQIFGVGELVGLIFAGVVLIVMLGSLLAASIPIVTALVGVGVGVTASLAFSGVVDMASVTPVLGVMLGLAVGIDYSLFIINRHRRQLIEGVAVRESIGLATGTAGTAVVFAGSTVVVALLALNITGVPFLGLMGTVGAVCVAIAVLIAITLAPAILGLAGPRLLPRRVRARVNRKRAVTAAAAAAAAAPVKRMPTARAVVTVLVSILALLIVAIPSLSMRLGLPDGSGEPVDSTSYEAFQTVEAEFGAGANGPLLVTAALPAGTTDEELTERQLDVARAISDLDDVVAVAPIAASDDNELAAFQVLPADGPNSESTADLVQSLRALPAVDGEIELGVAGQAASNIDISDALDAVLPLYLAVVVGLSLIIMVLVFRSVLVPLIATGGFVLSLFATYGLVVAVFQFGWGADLIGLESTGPILSFLPVILVGILFGLAMDYQLFLASGMREAYVHGADARLAVAQGFHAGRAVVTAAALIMASVFGGFIFSESTIIRSIGFGLAFGVLLDAFVVRMLLMPALMHLLGESAWWLPRWLDRILPDVDVEGARLQRDHPVGQSESAEVAARV